MLGKFNHKIQLAQFLIIIHDEHDRSMFLFDTYLHTMIKSATTSIASTLTEITHFHSCQFKCIKFIS